jgi:hypothetical protein
VFAVITTLLFSSFIPVPCLGELEPGTCYTCVPPAEKEELVREMFKIFDLPDDPCRAAKALGRYLSENKSKFPDIKNHFGIFATEFGTSYVSNLACREGGLHATLYNNFDEEPHSPGSGVPPKPEPSIHDARTPPEFQSAVFKCIGDYELCKNYYEIKEARFDAEVGCGAAFLICTGQNLISFVKK